MRFKLLLTSLVFCILYSSNAQCLDCEDSTDQIAILSDNYLTASLAQAYYWEICSGTASINGSNTSRTVQINCGSGEMFKIQLVQFINGQCIESCESYVCSPNGDLILVDDQNQGPPALPNISCFGFDPVVPINVSSEGKLNVAYLNNYNSIPNGNNGITFNWFFKFKDHQLLTFNVENPTFRELCPTNPVMSFGVIISNGIETRKYYTPPVDPAYNLLGFDISDIAPDCSLHTPCDPRNSDLNLNNSFDKTETIEKDLKLFIDESKENIIIQSNVEGNHFQITLYELSGKEVRNFRLDGNKFSILGLNKGIYIYQIAIPGGTNFNGRILIE